MQSSKFSSELNTLTEKELRLVSGGRIESLDSDDVEVETELEELVLNVTANITDINGTLVNKTRSFNVTGKTKPTNSAKSIAFGCKLAKMINQNFTACK